MNYTDSDGKPINREGLKTLWRMEASTDDSRTHLFYTPYYVERHTAKGVFVHYGLKQKFVLLSGRKRFAFPTQEEARESFVQRKLAHIRHLKAALDWAQRELETAQSDVLHSRNSRALNLRFGGGA